MTNIQLNYLLKMDVTSEVSVDSNHKFQNVDCYDCLCRLFNLNQDSSRNWRPNIWHCISIFSGMVSVACLVTLVCMTGNSEHGTRTTATASQEIITELKIELNKLKKSIHQNRKHIAATRKRLEHSCLAPPDPVQNPDYNKTKRVTLECGGLIPLPSAGDSILLDYKSQESYKTNEKCLWILDSSTKNKEKYYAKIRISVLCEGFGDQDDGIFVFDWIDWERLTSFELSQIKDYSPSNSSGWHYLSFTSTNNSASVGGTGFILRLQVLEKSTEYHLGTNMALTESSGTVTYGLSSERDRIGMVVNPQWTSYTLILGYLESLGNTEGYCQDHDSLHIFTVGSSGSSTKLPLLCGTLKKRSYVFQDPVLVAFVTSSSPTWQGFSLSWMGAK